MAAHELLDQLLEGFRQAAPEADFREAYCGEPAGRILSRPVATGAVSRETEEGDGWEAALKFHLYLSRGEGPGAAERILDKMAVWTRENQPLLIGIERGAASVDKTSGSVAVGWTATFAKPGTSGGQSGKRTYPIYLNGRKYTVTGWKASCSEPLNGLTAIGEDEPFAREEGKEYTVELQGLDVGGLEELEDFTLRLGEQRGTYSGCRWRSLSTVGAWVLEAARIIGEE